MLNPFSIIAEAVARIEFKIDRIIELLSLMSKYSEVVKKDMGRIDETCPVCGKPVRYVVPAGTNVVDRQCGCNSGGSLRKQSSQVFDGAFPFNNQGGKSNG